LNNALVHLRLLAFPFTPVRNSLNPAFSKLRHLY